MKPAMQLAREFIATVDGLNSVPGMLTSHDLGKEAICRALLARDELVEDELNGSFFVSRVKDRNGAPTDTYCIEFHQVGGRELRLRILTNGTEFAKGLAGYAAEASLETRGRAKR